MSIRTTYHGFVIKEFGPDWVTVYKLDTDDQLVGKFDSVESAKAAIREALKTAKPRQIQDNKSPC
jgi:hypothetical protein